MDVDPRLFHREDDQELDGRSMTLDKLAVDPSNISRRELLGHIKQNPKSSLQEIGHTSTEHVFAEAANSTQGVSPDSLFQNIPAAILKGKDTFQVDVLAGAGCGKTTTFTKLAPYLWAGNNIWTGTFDNVVAREL